MSTTIKAIIFAVLLMSIQSVMGSEPKTLSVKEFQNKINSEKLNQEDLREYEINNHELIIL